MERVEVRFETDGGMRPSEIIADLRAAAETLYFPMKVVGFWDYRQDIHLCPQEERGEPCPHKLDEEDPDFTNYRHDLQRKRRATLEVWFPHAGVSLVLR